MAVTVGTRDRGDCEVVYDLEGTPGVFIQGPMSNRFESAVRQVAEEVLALCGAGGRLDIWFNGAFDWVVRARVRAALVSAGAVDDFPAGGPGKHCRPQKKLLRSLLYVPGDRPHMIANSGRYRADAVVLDLEDAVDLAHKLEARYLVAEAVASAEFGGSEVWVRINSLDKGGREDLKAVLPWGVNGVRIPKLERPEQVMEVVEVIQGCHCPSVALSPVIESPLGILNAYAIASASPLIRGLSWGGEDLRLAIGCSRGANLDHFRWEIILACRAAGVAAWDTVFAVVDDADSFRSDCIRSAEMGFNGRSVIHPAQIGIVHEAYKPRPEQVEWARQVVESVGQAGSGAGVGVVSGQMVDRPIILQAMQILEAAGETS
ncbi:MAG: CoA ester lyase [Clostridia bacterium]|nr:CoA ester lyase [Clostridia bacterium]